jgi:hypothetical protein
LNTPGYPGVVREELPHDEFDAHRIFDFTMEVVESFSSGLRSLLLGQETKTVKRRYQRVALPKGMLVAWQYSGGRGVARVATLGLGGLFIATPSPPALGTLIKLIFDVPGGEVRARAMVKNVKEGEGMAVAFIEMGYEERARLDQLVKKLA